MFVYNKTQVHSSCLDVSSLLVAAALILGGLSKMMAFPVAVGIALVFFCLPFVDEKQHLGPAWMGHLSLATTSLFYLGLGHCLGGLSLLALPALWLAKRL